MTAKSRVVASYEVISLDCAVQLLDRSLIVRLSCLCIIDRYRRLQISHSLLPTTMIDGTLLELALRSCLSLSDEEDDLIAFIIDDITRTIDTFPSSTTLSELSLVELESLPISTTLSHHLDTLLGEQPSPLLISSILDTYHSPPPPPSDDEPSSRITECELCERKMPLTSHHLLPRSEHDRLVKRGRFTLEECRTRIARLCRPCHSAVHRAAPLAALAEQYNTVERLLELDEVAKFARWASRQRPSSSGTRHTPGLRNKR